MKHCNRTNYAETNGESRSEIDSTMWWLFEDMLKLHEQENMGIVQFENQRMDRKSQKIIEQDEKANFIRLLLPFLLPDVAELNGFNELNGRLIP